MCLLFSLRKQENLICFAAAGKGGRELARDRVVAATRRARTPQTAFKQQSYGNVYLQEQLGDFWQWQVSTNHAKSREDQR